MLHLLHHSWYLQHFIKPHDDYQEKFYFSQLFVSLYLSLLLTPPRPLLCFISKLINSSEVQPFTLNPHLPVHMATGWPHSPTPSTPANRQKLTPAATHKPLHLNYTLPHTRGGPCMARVQTFQFLSTKSGNWITGVLMCMLFFLRILLFSLQNNAGIKIQL